MIKYVHVMKYFIRTAVKICPDVEKISEGKIDSSVILALFKEASLVRKHSTKSYHRSNFTLSTAALIFTFFAFNHIRT